MSKQVDKVKSEYDQLIEKSKKSTLESEALKVKFQKHRFMILKKLQT
jgi:hypothetical protein